MPGYEVFGAEERDAVLQVFDDSGGVLFAHGFDALRRGVYRVREYERAFAHLLGFRFGQAVSSGSAALYVSLKAAGVQAGDHVITQAHTYIATVEAILSVGAVPVIVEVDESLNMDPEAFQRAVSPRTRAVVPVHMLGQPANMDEICRTADQNGLLVVEDCAQALGARYRGASVGGFSAAAAFSTDAGKTLNTGEGGVIVTDTQATFEMARALHDHGHMYAESVPRGQDPALAMGFNFRMTELQGAVGLAQLSKLDFIVSRQRENKRALLDALGDLPMALRKADPHAEDNGDSLVVLLPGKVEALQFALTLADQGVGTKNLPDAMNWHFAAYWGHLGEAIMFGDDAASGWRRSTDVLERSVAIPVLVNYSATDISRIAGAIRVAWASVQ